ncbi:efflux RND transporter permease subunit [Thermodesulfovibrio yellowstonii]|uniref:AcrB/AcrD/AcrF family protein n=4 Tax=Thermodesulfovibrio yellowstonii TaxID=28262 RepID=B5YKJ4_THEYD|nr:MULTISPECIES: efflux RND transporter permease subunit [Thermodesulfovibrio]ACI20216.1 AcrB/AcrD/AcrF family protein [Thermodesulfovibrio yellowstonii DSM 11347]GLI53465.1 multidrug transporter [Thermodesulfovibrio islandicus]
MNFSQIFIQRPVMTTLLMLAIIVFGLVGYRYLPIAELPNVDFPTILVTANLPGASPETMASAVATPLEREFSTISGLKSMNSINAKGVTQITLEFDLNRDIDAAAQDVQTAISRASRQLPSNMPTPPTYNKVNPADMPILYFAITSPTMPLYRLHEYADTLLAQNISMVNGVAQVQIFGAQKYAVRVRIDPNLIASKGIGIDEVEQAIKKGNVELPTGTLYGNYQAFTIEATGQLFNASHYNELIIASKEGSPVKIKDIGEAVDSVENDKLAAWYGSGGKLQRAMVLAIYRQPGTNTVEVADNVKKKVDELKRQIPASVSLNLLYDRSQSIRESVRDVQFTLLFTVFLVVLVIFLFLRRLSATVIPSVALPISIIGTFAVMYLLGYSLDNLSLMALTLSIGFLVDDAIVMLENIVRHIEKGEKPFQAALNGSKEIWFTILSMTLSLVAVFIPVLFMGGIVGRLFKEFAVTISVAILISGLVSLTLTPMMCSRFLRVQNQKHGKLYMALEKGFEWMINVYKISLSWSLKHHKLMMIGSGVILIITAYIFVKIPAGFLPSEDKSQIFVMTEASEDISFDEMVRHQLQLADLILKESAVKDFMTSVGPSTASPAPNVARMFMHLKPISERPHVDKLINQLRPKLNSIPGLKVYPQNPPTIRIGGTLTKALYQFTLSGSNLEELYYYAQVLESKMKQIPIIQDVSSNLQIKTPQLNIEIDRAKAESIGVTAEQIENALWGAFGSKWISTIYAPNNQYEVILELKPEYQKDPSALSMLYIRSSKGELVPLNSVATVSQSIGPLTVNHTGQLPSVTISFNLKPDISLGEALSEIQKVAKATLPDTIMTSFQGAAQAFKESFQGLWFLLIVAVFVVYIVLGILYESFIHPITILSALPFAGFGALVTLLVFGVELNIYSFVGIIMLIGLVKKNGIMMIDFALHAQRNENMKAHEAIYNACLIRFRPIMMTTMAALFGALPIALGIGAGGEVRQPLGLAVVGGLLFSQMLTLFVTPVFYLYMDRLQNWLSRKKHL